MGIRSDEIFNKRVNKRIKKLHAEQDEINNRLNELAQDRKARMPLGLYNQLDRIEEEIEILTRLMEE